MKKHTEKQPIDDLFARKLGDMSITPGPKSWDELQNRMGREQNPRIVPVWYRYAAAAACLVLVGGIGWKVYQTSESAKPTTAVLANAGNDSNKAGSRKAEAGRIENLTTADTVRQQMAQVATEVPASAPENIGTIQKVKARQQQEKIPVDAPGPSPVTSQTPEEERMVARIPAPTEKLPVAPIEAPKPVVAESLKPGLREEPSERKLVVMINTPVLATSKASEVAGAIGVESVNKPETIEEEGLSKASKLFKKLKRIKNGEALAYKGETGDEEDSGLISRLYGNVRQSLETKKDSKQ
ncbi:hypothetical protein [Arsenicibacter rosenii]|uniref:Uncharacterized protein n=1 Tax=Arsenicibacter rosenii TaxID=1750698 RepID=A0A1S2VJF4_9BACT|nr:hypothetical protein [Arsenicibacter rosenii]OIN58907.1 hypothetical protein BLX24_11830 [Arsenicibacter rosenii]